MNHDPHHLLDALSNADLQRREIILADLRRRPALLEELCALANQQGRDLDCLNQLLLEISGPQIVRAYHAARNLEEGMWILPQLELPHGDYGTWGPSLLDRMASRFDQSLSPEIVARHLAEDYGISGDQRDYHHPHNCFLNRCLERRLGLPITLVGLWIMLCSRLNLRAWALTLPGHVVGGWEHGWVDCFHGGKVLTREQLDHLASHSGNRDASAYIEGASTDQLLQRMALNAAVAYRQRGDALRALIATSMAGRPATPP